MTELVRFRVDAITRYRVEVDGSFQFVIDSTAFYGEETFIGRATINVTDEALTKKGARDTVVLLKQLIRKALIGDFEALMRERQGGQKRISGRGVRRLAARPPRGAGSDQEGAPKKLLHSFAWPLGLHEGPAPRSGGGDRKGVRRIEDLDRE